MSSILQALSDITEVGAGISGEVFIHQSGGNCVFDSVGCAPHLGHHQTPGRALRNRAVGQRGRNCVAYVKWLRNEPDYQQAEGRNEGLQCHVPTIIRREGVEIPDFATCACQRTLASQNKTNGGDKRDHGD